MAEPRPAVEQDSAPAGEPAAEMTEAPAAEPEPLQPAAPIDPAESGALEELVLPSAVQPPAALAAGTQLGPDGRLLVDSLAETRGRVNVYAARWRDERGGTIPVELHEAPLDHPPLQRASEVLDSVQYSMLPKRYAGFETADRRYLALERLEGVTLAEALGAGLSPERAVSLAVQLVQALRRLHQAGWALLGLWPSGVLLSEPLRLTELGQAVRLGERPPQALHLAGYSAPETVLAEPVSGKEDVYALGAVLYHALAGQPLPEAGLSAAELPDLVPLPGGPQLLARALAPVEERFDLQALYAALLALKQRLGRRPLALEIASGTSLGLNPTRLANEDACGYLNWSVAGEDATLQCSLLCVADGMGGMEAGEVASQTALHTVLQAATAATTEQLPPGEPRTADAERSTRPGRPTPVELVRLAAPAVHAAANGRQVGTTMTCVLIEDGELTLGHVGDTRAYLLRGDSLTRLTDDHSLVASMVASGVLTPEEARGHPDSNKVLRSLGGRRELPERYVDDLAAAYGQPSLRLQPGDWLLLCSDGVWGSVEDERISTTLRQAADCPAAVHSLLEQALRAGAPDNASAVVARCAALPSV